MITVTTREDAYEDDSEVIKTEELTVDEAADHLASHLAKHPECHVAILSIGPRELKIASGVPGVVIFGITYSGNIDSKVGTLAALWAAENRMALNRDEPAPWGEFDKIPRHEDGDELPRPPRTLLEYELYMGGMI